MCNRIIYTYSSLKELNRIYEGDAPVLVDVDVYSLSRALKQRKGYVFDITPWIQLISVNEGVVIQLIECLNDLDDSNKVIVNERYAQSVLMNLHAIFSTQEPFYPNKYSIQDHSLKRHILYTYTQSELDHILEYFKDKGVKLYDIDNANKYYGIEFDSTNEIIVDITPDALACGDNKNILYVLSRSIGELKNAVFMAEKKVAENAIKELPYCFKKIDSIYNKFDRENPTKSEIDDEKVNRFIDCDRQAMDDFRAKFDKDLIGQDVFKQSLYKGLKNFRTLNKIGEKKIYSIFLFGPSGVGKTEVGRLMSKWLCSSSSISKINFGNYSSKDALNSLIGSPAGYIGYKNGELSKKLSKNKAGVVIFDEFEKADQPIYNFFLELLEDGSYTDSSGTEYDLNGYVFIFTSNILTEDDFYKKLPSELISRFDLVCHFNLLRDVDKKRFVDQLTDKYVNQLQNVIDDNNIEMEFAKTMISAVPYADIDNLRDIKRIVQNNVSDLLERLEENEC